MDSTGIPAGELPAQYETLNFLIPLILGLVVMPLVGLMKRFTFVGKGKALDPSQITIVFLIFSLWGISHIVPPAMTFMEAVKYGLMVSGGVLLAYRTYRQVNPK
jgi:hypothetical protein